MATISVIIPAFNHAEFITETILSVLNSQKCDVEIIVVDDGSTDATAKIVAGFTSVKYYYQENRGAHAAINFGLGQATSNFVSILNDDDLYSPNYLAEALDTLQSYDLDMVASIPQLIGHGPKLKSQIAHFDASLEAIESLGLLPALFKINWFVSTSGLIFKKEVIDATQGFRSYKLCHDLDFVLRAILKHNFKIGLHTSSPWYYRCHGTNSSSSIGSHAGNLEILDVLLGVLSDFQEYHSKNAPFENLIGHGISKLEISNFFNHEKSLFKHSQ